MTDVSLSIFRSKFKKTRIQMIDYINREGTRILVRYEAWLRPDSYIEGHMEVVGAGY